MTKITGKDPRTKTADCLFLCCMVIFSSIPYISNLGFYADDWSYWSELAARSPQSLTEMIRMLMSVDPSLVVRPVQAILLALEFRFFGLNPLPYHVVGAVILSLAVVILHLALLEFGLSRWKSFAITLIFGLLPHYSAAKFWISSQQASLCIAFAGLGIYAIHRSIRLEEMRRTYWTVIAALALTLSLLSYEVAIGLIACNLVYAAWILWKRRAQSAGNFGKLAGLLAIIAVLVIVGTIKALNQTRMVYHHNFATLLSNIGAIAKHATEQALVFLFWVYGLHLPSVLFSMHRGHALTWPAITISICLALISGIYSWRLPPSHSETTLKSFLVSIALAFLTFWAGFALFVLDPNTDVRYAGVQDRVEVASAIGAAVVLVAFSELISSFLKGTSKKIFQSTAIAFLCLVNCLTTSGIAWFWHDAANRQTAILNSVSTHVKNLPDGSVLLLDGFCRYSGPAVVFGASWDTTGAIQIALRNFTLIGDLVSSDLNINDDAIDVAAPNHARDKYLYGPALYVYNVKKVALVQLSSKQVAAGYRREMDSANAVCPPGQQSFGTKVF